jgi:hypothetical protein
MASSRKAAGNEESERDYEMVFERASKEYIPNNRCDLLILQSTRDETPIDDGESCPATSPAKGAAPITPLRVQPTQSVRERDCCK